MVPQHIAELLAQPYTLTRGQVDFYDRNRYIKLRGVLDGETLDFFSAAIGEEVDRLKTENRPLESRDTYGKAFLQLFNLWQENQDIRALVFSKRLAGIASQLMQTTGARLYHDQALFKEGGGGITPWHADQYYWPLETDRTVTAWIPLQETPLEMGPLEFSAGSHTIVEGRELAIGDESEAEMKRRLRVTDFEHVVEPFEAGEVSFHSGWIFHRAGANLTDRMRKVMTVIYMDRDMALRQPENESQENDRQTWCPGAEVGEVIDSPLNPVLFP